MEMAVGQCSSAPHAANTADVYTSIRKRKLCTRKHRRATHRSLRVSAKGEVPLPSAAFTREDLIRIRDTGPSIEDVTLVASDPEDEEVTVKYIPAQSVLGKRDHVGEPKWRSLKCMPVEYLYHGLQQRNWQNSMYDPKVTPWQVTLYKCQGRSLHQEPFSGLRVLVEQGEHVQDTPPHTRKLDRSNAFWVQLPVRGESVFSDEMTIQGWKGQATQREVGPAADVDNVGTEHVMQQIWQAHGQRTSRIARDEMARTGTMRHTAVDYDVPGERMLRVQYASTPKPSVDLDRLHKSFIPLTTVILCSSFVIGSLIKGVFFPQKGKPLDLNQVFEFAQSKSDARIDNQIDTRFDDVASLDQIKAEVTTIVQFLKNPEEYSRLGARPPKGVLFEGAPGCGKTLMAKAIAGESNVPFYSLTGSDFVELIVGVGAARVRDVFDRARVNAPCILFIDEIDALGVSRSQANEMANEEREQALNQLLTEMDGFTPDTGVVIIAATNRADLLDAALLRAGRFDIKLKISPPDTEGRYQILKVHSQRYNLADDVDLRQLARDLPGLSGADLANLLSVAALLAVRQKQTLITRQHVYSAVDRVLQGTFEDSVESEEVRTHVAYHEIGRAVVSQCLHDEHRLTEGVERVVLKPRRGELSCTHFLRENDELYDFPTRRRFMLRIMVILSGIASEDEFTGDPSTYSQQDLRDAYTLATQVITTYGLSSLGITTFSFKPPKRSSRRAYDVQVAALDEDSAEVEGMAVNLLKPGNEQRHTVHKEAVKMINECYASARQLLRARSKAVHALVEEALVDEILPGDRLVQVLKENPAQDVDPVPVRQVDLDLEVFKYPQGDEDDYDPSDLAIPDLKRKFPLLISS